VIDLPTAYQYTCFHLEYQGLRVNDFMSIAEIPNIISGGQLHVVLDPYTEKEARLHLVRIRELIGAAGDRTDTSHGIAHGISIFDDLTRTTNETDHLTFFRDYEFSLVPSFKHIISRPSDHVAAPKTVKGITLSSWNPPPFLMRQKGHLLYILVTTMEGEQYHITSHVGGFFVNKCSNSKFDPLPRASPRTISAHSLLALIEQLSPSFTDSFESLQKFNARKEALSTFQITNTLPAHPWIVPPSLSDMSAHIPDPTRSQESYLIAGIDNADSLRDWNEEIQSAKELPNDTIQDRLFRERLVSKLYADYVDAATRGAVLVARGEVAPLNPTETTDAQIFVYNNVFFSFGADGVGTFSSEGGDDAARVATGKDVAGVRMVNQLDIDGLYTPGTVVVDYLGKRIVGQSIVPGIFRPREPGETQIDYGAVDGKDVIASDERFVDVFQRMSRALKVKKHAVWDKDGKRVELEASVETKGLLGTDGRKYALDLYRITPLDVLWLEECSEQASTGSLPAYPHRMTILRPELVELYGRYKVREYIKAQAPRDSDTERQGDDVVSRTDADVKSSQVGDNESSPLDTRESSNAIGSGQEVNKEGPDAAPHDSERQGESQTITENHVIDLPMLQAVSLNPDVFCGQVPQTDVEKMEMSRDELEVRQVCLYLKENAIPDLLRDLRGTDISFPMDGASLGRLLHKRGINIRYIGYIASTCGDDHKLDCLRHLCIQEMISRAFKHIASRHMRLLPTTLVPACVSHLLNCFLGRDLNPSPQSHIDPSLRQLYPTTNIDFESVTPVTLRAAIEDEVRCRYRYNLGASWLSASRHLQILRQVSLQLGVQLLAREYLFIPSSLSTPETQQKQSTKSESKKKRKARDKAATGYTVEQDTLPPIPHTFFPDDIINFVPIVKHSCPRSALAEEALEAGRLSLAQDQRKIGQELLLESLSLHEQIYGILHPEVARAYSSLSNLYFQLDDKEAAVELARKAVIVSERTLGIDSGETLLNYLNLSLFLHQAGDSISALSYSKHALDLIMIVYGPDHPDSITTLNNIAVMLQSLKAFHESRIWFDESLRVCDAVYGRQSINSATLLFQLAQALALDHDSKGAVNCMRASYNIFLSELGSGDRNTKEAENWLEQLTQNAVSIARHAREVQTKRSRGGIRYPPQDLTNNAPVESPSTSPRTGVLSENSSRIDSRSIDELMKFIEGAELSTHSAKVGRRGRGNLRQRRQHSST
jgi:protein TIF31